MKKLAQHFMELVEIDALPFQEGKMADRLEKEMKELGFWTERDEGNQTYHSETGNLYGFLKGTLEGEPLVFSAHMDTVSPGKGKKPNMDENGRITSDGDTVLGADDLTGVVEILEAVAYLQKNDLPHRDIEILFCFAEEMFLKGSKVADYSKIKGKEAYVLDLEGDIGTISLKAPSVLAFTLTVNGRAAHAGFAPYEGIHAIQIMSEIITGTPMGILDGDLRVNFGTITGGHGRNIVAPSCSSEGEIRSHSHKKVLEKIAEIEKTVRTICDRYQAEYTLEYDVPCVAYETEENDPVVKRFDRACRACGIMPVHTQTYGGSDMNNFSIHGMKGVVLACGMHKVHTKAEFTNVNEMWDTIKILVEMMQDREV